MILAAGLGTRLKPWTLEHPKALVPVDGIPMLERVILKLKSQGFDEIVVNVHHFAGQITDFLDSKRLWNKNKHKLMSAGTALTQAVDWSMRGICWKGNRFLCTM